MTAGCERGDMSGASADDDDDDSGGGGGGDDDWAARGGRRGCRVGARVEARRWDWQRMLVKRSFCSTAVFWG
jgi:hypothetical protein